MKPWIEKSVFSSAMQSDMSLIPLSGKNECNLSLDTTKVATLSEAIEALFNQAISSLNRLSICFKTNHEASTTIRGLRDLIRIIRDRPMTFEVQDQFRLIYPFSTFMKPLSTSLLSINENEPFLIATLAHLFAVNILLGIVFPAMNVPAFVPTQARSLSAIGVWTRSTSCVYCDVCRLSHQVSELMTFPMNTLTLYRQSESRI